MVDVFGRFETLRGTPGPLGPVGLPGSNGTIKDVCKWLPKTTLNKLQLLDEKGCFVLHDQNKDLEYDAHGNVVKWVSQCLDGPSLITDILSKNLVRKIKEHRYALVFNESRFISSNLMLLPRRNGYSGFLCFTLKINSFHEEKIMATNYHKPDANYDEIYVTNKEIKIRGNRDGGQYHYNISRLDMYKWTTFFIDYVSVGGRTNYWYTIINGGAKSYGEFYIKNGRVIYNFTIGSRREGSKFLDGEIAGIEMYHDLRSGKRFPESIRDLVIANQVI